MAKDNDRIAALYRMPSTRRRHRDKFRYVAILIDIGSVQNNRATTARAWPVQHSRDPALDLAVLRDVLHPPMMPTNTSAYSPRCRRGTQPLRGLRPPGDRLAETRQ